MVGCRSVLPVAVAYGHATFECCSLAIPMSTKLPNFRHCFASTARLLWLFSQRGTQNRAGDTQVPYDLHNLGSLSSRTAQHAQVIGEAMEDLLSRS